MPNDYRALHNQYAQGMSQPGTVTPNSQQGFNFLQGWAATPTAGYLPPRQAQQEPIQYGTPTQGGWIGDASGQPIGGSQAVNAGNPWMVNGQDPRAMQNNGIHGDWQAWRRAQASGAGDPRLMQNDGINNNFNEWARAYTRQPAQGGMQANYGMQQPGYLPKPMPNFGDSIPKPIPDFGIPMPKPIIPEPWGGG